MIGCVNSILSNSEFIYTLSGLRGYTLLYQSVDLDANEPTDVKRWERNVNEHTIHTWTFPKWEVVPLHIQGVKNIV